jgi:hypothetical protein
LYHVIEQKAICATKAARNAKKARRSKTVRAADWKASNGLLGVDNEMSS